MSNNNEFWLQTSRFTDPGEYRWMYDSLPDTIPEICEVIHKQLIHIVMANNFSKAIKRKIEREDFRLQTVASMLQALNERCPGTLINERTPDERIIVTCRSYSILLASILKHKKIPCRVRVGFAPYIKNDGSFIDHWICEYLDTSDDKWKLVDPDTRRYNISDDDFVLSGRAWQGARKKELDPEKFGWGDYWGSSYILNNLCCDLACITGSEVFYCTESNISLKELEKLNCEEVHLLDETAELLRYPENCIDHLTAMMCMDEFKLRADYLPADKV